MTEKTDFLIDNSYLPSGMVDVEGFLPTEQLRPTFWESTQAMFGHNYDSQYEAFREDLEFNTKGYARPFMYYMGLIGQNRTQYGGMLNIGADEQDIDTFKQLQEYKDKEEVQFDPNFNPFDKELIRGYEEHALYFADAKNLDHFEFKKRVLDENVARREVIRMGGFWQNLGAAFLDPINFIALPFGGPTVGLARSAVRVGAGTGVIVAAQEMTRYPFDPLATPGEVGMSIGAATVFGGILGGVLGLPATVAARRLRNNSDNFSKSVAFNNKHTDEATHSIKEAQIRSTGRTNIKPTSDRFIEDVLVPYSKAQVDDVISEGAEILTGIKLRQKVLKDKNALSKLASQVGDTVDDYAARVTKEVEYLQTQAAENKQTQQSKIFKDSKRLAEGKIKQFKVGDEVYDTKKIEALADRDQLISNKNAYDKQIPILEQEAVNIGKEIAKLNTPEFREFLDKLKEEGVFNPNTNKVEKFGVNKNEKYNPSDAIHVEQLRGYAKKDKTGRRLVELEDAQAAVENRISELEMRATDNKKAIRFRRKSLDKFNEGFKFAENIYIKSPLFQFIFNPIKDLLTDSTATAISKYYILKLGFDSGLNLELIKRGFKLGNSVHQNKAKHMAKLYDFTIKMRSFYLESVGMSPLRSSQNLFSMEQVEWQKLYQTPRRLMAGGVQKTEREFFHDITVRYITGEAGDTDMENAAIQYMIKTFKKEKIEKEAVGLLGGANFERGKPFRLRQDIDARVVKKNENLEKIKQMEADLKRGFFEKDGKQIKYTKEGRAKQEFHIKRRKKWDESYAKTIKLKTDNLNEVLARLDDIKNMQKSGENYFDENFFPRNFNIDMIRANREEFEELLTTELMKTTYRVTDDGKRTSGTLTRDDASKLAKETTQKILLEQEDKVEEIFVGAGISKHLKSRVLDIPNSRLIKFIHTDPFAVYKKYVQQTSGMVEFKREFGTFKTIDDIQDDIFEEAFDKGLDVADAEKHFLQVRYMYDRVVTNRLHDNPYRWDKYLVNLSRTFAQLSYLGGVVFSTMAEPSVIMMNHGVGKTMFGLFEAFFNPQVRAAIKEVAKAGEAIDLTLGTSHQRFVNEMSFNSMSDHLFDKSKNAFYILNGLTVVTTALKRLDGVLRIDHYINSALKVSNPKKYGKASQFEVEYLLRYNIGKKEAKKIEGLVDDGTITKSKDDASGLWLANTDNWKDISFRDDFRASVASGVLNTILMGTPADKPKLVDGIVFLRTSTVNKAGLGGLFKESVDYPGYVKFDVPLLGMPFQFFSYSFAAVNKVTASLTQGALKSRVMAPLIGVGLAYWSLSLRKPDYIWDEMSMQDKMLQSFEYSGVAAIYMDLFYESLHTILAVRGENFTGGFISPKYQDTAHESLIGLLGAGPSHTFDMGKSIMEMLNGDFGKGASDLMKILPFLSLPYVKSHVRDLGAAIDERLD